MNKAFGKTLLNLIGQITIKEIRVGNLVNSVKKKKTILAVVLKSLTVSAA